MRTLLPPPVLPFLVVLAAALSGCGAKTDGSTSTDGDTGGNVALPGAGGNQAGADQGTSITSTAGTTLTTGGASASGVGNTGGTCASGSRKSMPSIGGNTARGTAVCNSPSVCGTVLDGSNPPIAYDCGYTNCPTALCGTVVPNQCPSTCRAKPICGSTDCGPMSDGCGGIIECMCGCQTQSCPAGVCGKYPDGCGGELDCGPCCTPFTCEDWCPADDCGNIRECSPTKDDINVVGATYICPCPKPDGCTGVLDCWCPCV
jgi:hypothetical protein